jgi:hypothetical protein
VDLVKSKRPATAVLWRGATVAFLVGALVVAANAGRTGDAVVVAILLIPALVLFAATVVGVFLRR